MELWFFAQGICSLNLEDSVHLYHHLVSIGQSPLLSADPDVVLPPPETVSRWPKSNPFSDILTHFFQPLFQTWVQIHREKEMSVIIVQFKVTFLLLVLILTSNTASL